MDYYCCLGETRGVDQVNFVGCGGFFQCFYFDGTASEN